MECSQCRVLKENLVQACFICTHDDPGQILIQNIKNIYLDIFNFAFMFYIVTHDLMIH